MLHRALPRIAVAAVIAVAATCLAVAPTARAGNSVTYPNSPGDPAAPDITSVTVSNDDNGLITFAIAVPSQPTLSSNVGATVFIDPGMNPGDGAGPDFEGASLALDVSQGSVDLGKWNGSTFDFSGGSPSSLVYSWQNGVLTIKVSARDLQVTSFDFWVLTATLDGSGNPTHTDAAPQAGHGSFRYDVKISPPPPAKPVSAPSASVPKCKKHQHSTKAHRCHR